jgi:hypothetical protein
LGNGINGRSISFVVVLPLIIMAKGQGIYIYSGGGGVIAFRFFLGISTNDEGCTEKKKMELRVFILDLYISPLTLYYMGHSFAGASVYTCVSGDAESKVTHKRMWILRPFKSKSTREKGQLDILFHFFKSSSRLYNSASTCCLLWPFYL